jgi:DNA-binding MarR family transcriptional regulator
MNEKREKRSSSEHVANTLRDVTLSYYRFIAIASQQAKLRTTELMALGYLRDRGPLRAGQLGERLGLTTGSITALIDRLERVGYAHRLRHPTDRRIVLVELTAAGRTEVGTLFQLLASNVETALDDMTAGEQEAVARFLNEIHSSFERRGEEALEDSVSTDDTLSIELPDTPTPFGTATKQ